MRSKTLQEIERIGYRLNQHFRVWGFYYALTFFVVIAVGEIATGAEAPSLSGTPLDEPVVRPIEAVDDRLLPLLQRP